MNRYVYTGAVFPLTAWAQSLQRRQLGLQRRPLSLQGLPLAIKIGAGCGCVPFPLRNPM